MSHIVTLDFVRSIRFFQWIAIVIVWFIEPTSIARTHQAGIVWNQITAYWLKLNNNRRRKKKSFLVNWDLKWGSRAEIFIADTSSYSWKQCSRFFCTKQLSKVFCTHFSISLTTYNSWHIKWCSSYFSVRKQILELSIHSKIFCIFGLDDVWYLLFRLVPI